VEYPRFLLVSHKQRFAAFVRYSFQSLIAVSSQNRIETVGVSKLPHQGYLHHALGLQRLFGFEGRWVGNSSVFGLIDTVIEQRMEANGAGRDAA